MDAPLYNRIRALTGNYPMHMPGHKRRADILPCGLLEMDITEIEGSDNLHSPHGVIADAEKKFAELYGADRSFFCVNGGTSGILAAIIGCCTEKDTVLCVRNAHKSLQNALILSGSGARYISTRQSGYGYALPAEAEPIERALGENEDIMAVFIVSPTYEGFCADIRKIAEVAHKYGKILIVDETHGAHFPFGEEFPESASAQGADIAITSWHKTMPVPNQCAVLNIGGGRVDVGRVEEAFSMVTTTSPSYIFMGLMDHMRAYYSEKPEIFKGYARKMLQIREKLSGLKNIRLAEENFGADISKLTFISSEKNIKRTAEALKSEYGFELEMVAERHIVAMTSVADELSKLEEFAAAVIELDGVSKVAEKPLSAEYVYDVSERVVQRKLFYAEKEFIGYKGSEGRTAAVSVTPFPPDIPLIMAGEKLTGERIRELKKLLDSGVDVLGTDSGKICVIKE